MSEATDRFYEHMYHRLLDDYVVLQSQLDTLRTKHPEIWKEITNGNNS